MPLDKPFVKSEKTVTFEGEDGQEIEVVSDISAAGLRILKKQGYKKQSQRHREQEDAALAKGEKIASEDSDDDDAHDPPKPKDEISTGPDLQVKKAAPAKAAGRRA